ncbi:restriction endonuclease subunit S [Psychrobacter sp. FDAARGOS_221]|uniref:restriction endonuclease subunit S n=1 Tax=Psychrobacter sp. FDAARGOS_221 TaxID=1975705 RepID=UPI000BB58529|nr:restriction endonuclease subunit S [Psychrobacter sp. FDAARGOS_221]PNK59500.1 restriction endonuclease subunit S [Psychrobacter sp. FDAARGOS_221]
MTPNGWEVKTLGSLTDKIGSGKTPKGGSSTYKSYGIPLIRSQNVLWGSLDLSDVAYIDEEQHSSMKNSSVIESDVLLNITGASIGRVAMSTLKEANVNQHVCIIRPKKDLDNKFLQYNLLSFEGQKQIERFQAGGNRQGLNFEQIKSFKIMLPPLPEQQKIAKILTTWDNAIDTTERLIDNSKQQKKALMQQLLTGKKRLLDGNGKPFEGEWENLKLSDLYSFKRGKGISKGQITDSGNKCVLYGELYTYYGEVIRDVKSRTLETNSIKSKQGDVLIPASTTTTGIDLANATAVLEDDILLGGDINILRPKKSINPIFMAHLLTHFKKHEIARKAQGITIIHVYGRDLANIAVQIPSSLEEQQKIVAVLTNADKEIELLEQQLADLQQEKKALMQVLLTGKVRVGV